MNAENEIKIGQTVYANMPNSKVDDGRKGVIENIIINEHGDKTYIVNYGWTTSISHIGWIRTTEKPSYKNGLAELSKMAEKYYNEYTRYENEFTKMMEDENNDGTHPPRAYDLYYESWYNLLKKDLPLASAYLRAKNMLNKSSVYAYSAAKKAIKMLENGGSAEDANAIMDNWLPQDIMWD
jgi:hypothetical protein